MKYSPRTTSKNLQLIRRFLEWLRLHSHVKINEIQKEHVRIFLREVNSNYMYAQYLKSLRSFYRDFLGMPWVVEGFRYPPQAVKIRSLPSKKELQIFYHALSRIKDKALFLMYATSGLRRSEVLSLSKSNIDWSMRMITPNHVSRTKRSYVSFFNEECEKDLKEYLKSRRDNSNKLFRYSTSETDKLWAEARERTGLNITPQILRSHRQSACPNVTLISSPLIDLRDRTIKAAVSYLVVARLRRSEKCERFLKVLKIRSPV